MSENARHEVVADSEDEGEMRINPVLGKSPVIGLNLNTSPIQTADFTTPAVRSSRPSTIISAFTESLINPSIAGPVTPSDPIATSTTANPPKRPRPKPAYKGNNAPSNAGETSFSSNTSFASPNTASTSTNPTSEIQTATTSSSGPAAAKPRARPKPAYKGAAATGLPSFSTIEEGSSLHNQGDLFVSDIAERAKMRTQQRKSKQKGKQTAVYTDVIELSSDDDEMLLVPTTSKAQSKPKITPKEATRSSPRKKVKIAQHKRLEEMAPDSTPISLPLATSDFHMAPSSQLPPSDPPLPSPATLPPTSTPALAFGAPPGDLSPLTSPIQESKKRKRASNEPDPGDLDSIDLPGGASVSSRKPDEPIPCPEPPFFAASSSSIPAPQPSSDPAPRQGSEKGSEKPAKNPRKRKPKVQADAADPLELADIGQGSVPPEKPKPKRRRKKDIEDEDDWAGDDPPAKTRKTPAKKTKTPAAPKSKVRKSKMQVVVEIPETTKKKSISPATSKVDVEDDKEGSVGKVGVEETSSRGASTSSTARPAAPRGLSELPALEVDAAGSKRSSVQPASERGSTKEPVASSGTKSVASAKSKGKKRAIVDSDEEFEEVQEASSSKGKGKKADGSESSRHSSVGLAPKSSLEDRGSDSGKGKGKEKENDNIAANNAGSSSPYPVKSSSSPRYTIPSKSKSTPMSELIRKVNSLPGSPFSSARPTYSPLVKSSRSLLRKMAPLHPNRRTPPPPPPRPPPPKKTKKQLELEEKWEMELEDSVDGWYCLPEEERAALRRAKRNAEMGFED